MAPTSFATYSQWDKIINVLLKWIAKVDTKRKCQLSNYSRHFTEQKGEKTGSNNHLNRNRPKVKKNRSNKNGPESSLFHWCQSETFSEEHMYAYVIKMASYECLHAVVVFSTDSIVGFPFSVFTVTFFLASVPFSICYLKSSITFDENRFLFLLSRFPIS